MWIIFDRFEVCTAHALLASQNALHFAASAAPFFLEDGNLLPNH